MKLGNRFAALGDRGGGWDLYLRAKQMLADGEPILNLTVGDHDIPTEQPILDAMHRSATAGRTGYTMLAGITPLRQRIAELATTRTGVQTNAGNVVIFNGGQAALFAAHLAALSPGDRGVFPDPYYPTYPPLIAAVGGQAVALQTQAERKFVPDFDRLEEITKDARTLLINSPNNPTGSVYPKATLESVADIAMRNDLWLISDEVYCTQVWNGCHHSLRAVPGMVERCFVVGSMSKSHAMTGSRIGWLIGPEDAMEAITDLVTAMTFGVPEFIQEAALFALEQGAELEERIAAPFRRRRQIALELLDAQDAVNYVPPDGAMYLMIDVRPTGLSGIEFANRLLDHAGVAVMPGESFGQAAAGHVRVALTVAEDAVRTALGRLVACAADWSSTDATRSISAQLESADP